MPMVLLQKNFWFEIELLSKKCKNFFRGNVAQDQMIRANLFFYYVYKMRNNALSVN